MRFSTIIIALGLAASSTFAGLVPTAENTDPVARALPLCQPPSTKTGIIRPKANATIYTEKNFLFSFCSPTYFKVSSEDILVGFELPDGSVNLVANNVPRKSYTQNLTVHNWQVSEGAQKLVVYEVQGGYYTFKFVKYTQPVNVKYSPGSNDYY
ncbi:unnamed protein product [Tilletia controversa]|uniref:Uncharacterized protein n=3 Tax=Tilletia TaxID=13289 RepID=A0A8X7T0M0_9BASI|nr:hypothetical protein CF336_g271 [Tilletia laevis]KAE8202388.1 hypothetical protein CF328_g2245 [Tilletia controversa]KAE8265541.1 hypothetical protein A4X03_0g190 [Tilletia caries]KAE8206818.1 hypothetical protein CF335_g1600 [Tilletia laevis]KAE8255335.1 hypothetical protein A4X06_0g469 [Tilletia controversa]